MANGSKVGSGFIVDKKDLSQDEKWALILYCANDPENKEEKWELEIQERFNWICGSHRGEDTGKFYRWLVGNGLDKKIEIVRG